MMVFAAHKPEGPTSISSCLVYWLVLHTSPNDNVVEHEMIYEID